MKRQDISTKDFISMKWKQYQKYRIEQRKKRHIELTTDELLKLKQLKEEITLPMASVILLPLYATFYLGLFVIISNLAFNIDLEIYALFFIMLLFKFWKYIILAWFISVIVIALINESNTKKLANKIISERRSYKI